VGDRRGGLAGHLIGRAPQAPEEQRGGGEAQVRKIERLSPGDVARSAAFVVVSPHRVAVNEILVRAADQAW
jgi:NADP-dependent 3-hydroxy acid dehydrogenase YdfG